MIYMLTPSYTQNDKKKQRPKRKQKATKQKSKLPWKLTLSMLLVIILMLTAWMQERSISGNQAEDEAIHDFSQLLNWSEELMDGGAAASQWAFRWDVTLEAGSMNSLADELFVTARGELLPRTIRERGNAIDGQWILPHSTLKLALVEQEHTTEKVTVLLVVDAKERINTSELKKSVEEVQQSLQATDQSVQMNIKVFGQAKHEQVLNDLKLLSVAQTIDEYVDRGTNTITLFSNRIKQYRWLSNGKMVNIQASLHKSSVDEKHSLTIGTPLISGEFGEIVLQTPTNIN